MSYESEDLEKVLRSELTRNGQRWSKQFKTMSDKEREIYLGKLLVRRLVAEECTKRYAKNRQEDDSVPYRGDPEVMATRGTLNHSTGGGKRNVRGTNSCS